MRPVVGNIILRIVAQYPANNYTRTHTQPIWRKYYWYDCLLVGTHISVGVVIRIIRMICVMIGSWWPFNYAASSTIHNIILLLYLNAPRRIMLFNRNGHNRANMIVIHVPMYSILYIVPIPFIYNNRYYYNTNALLYNI